MRTYLPSFSRLCFVFAWMVCMTPAVLAQSVNVDLIESLRLAKAHDPQYAAAQAQRDQSLIKREQMAPLWDAQTQAMVTTGLGGQDVHVTQARAMGQNGVGFDSSISAGALARVGVTTQKPIRNPALDVQSQMLDIGARIGDVQWAQAQQDLRWRVVQRYFDVLSAQQSLEVLQRQSDTLIKAEKEISRRQTLGDATTMDVQEAQARLALVRAQVLQAKLELDTKWLAYRQMTGAAPQSLRSLSEKSAWSNPDSTALPQWLIQAQAQSSALQMADLQIGLQEEEARRVRLAAQSPTLDWVGQAQLDRLTGYGMSGTATQQITGYVMGVQWRTPLGAQNLSQAREREALKTAEKLRSDKMWTQSQLDAQVTEAWQALQSTQERLQALALAHQLNQKRLRTTRQAHQLGTRTTMEWLGAEQDAAQAELLWRLTRIQVWVTQARLWWSSSALDDAQVMQLNQQLQ